MSKQRIGSKQKKCTTTFVCGNVVDSVILYGVLYASLKNGVYSWSGKPSFAAKAGRPLGKSPDELEACQSTTLLTLPK